MTLRGDFDPTQFVEGDQDTFPPTDERDPLTDEVGEILTDEVGDPLTTEDIVYYDGDQWNVITDGPFQGLDMTTGGRLFARVT